MDIEKSILIIRLNELFMDCRNKINKFIYYIIIYYNVI